MKLWYAFMFSEQDSSVTGDAVYIVRAPDPLVCARLVESNPGILPGFIDPFITGIIEMGMDTHSQKAEVLAGPMIGQSDYETHSGNVYWRREAPNEPWVNFSKMYEGAEAVDCFYPEKTEQEGSLQSEEEMNIILKSVLAGKYDQSLDELEYQLDLCIAFLKANSLLDEYEAEPENLLKQAMNYLTTQMIKSAWFDRDY